MTTSPDSVDALRRELIEADLERDELRDEVEILRAERDELRAHLAGSLTEVVRLHAEIERLQSGQPTA